jgi:hypothetical protein
LVPLLSVLPSAVRPQNQPGAQPIKLREIFIIDGPDVIPF